MLVKKKLHSDFVFPGPPTPSLQVQDSLLISRELNENKLNFFTFTNKGGSCKTKSTSMVFDSAANMCVSPFVAVSIPQGILGL